MTPVSTLLASLRLLVVVACLTLAPLLATPLQLADDLAAARADDDDDDDAGGDDGDGDSGGDDDGGGDDAGGDDDGGGDEDGGRDDDGDDRGSRGGGDDDGGGGDDNSFGPAGDDGGAGGDDSAGGDDDASFDGNDDGDDSAGDEGSAGDDDGDDTFGGDDGSFDGDDDDAGGDGDDSAGSVGDDDDGFSGDDGLGSISPAAGDPAADDGDDDGADDGGGDGAEDDAGDDDDDGGDTDEAEAADQTAAAGIGDRTVGTDDAADMRRLGAAAEAALLGRWQGPPEAGPSPGGESRRAFADEILGVALGVAERAELQSLGYAILQVRPLETLGLDLVRIGISGSLTLDAELDFLSGRFPQAVFDRHHLYRPSSTCTAPQCFFSEALTGLPRGAAGCGAGVRIGMIDALVDARFAALQGQRVTVRDIAGTGERAAEHGTAVASLLVGAGQSRSPGLLPAAELFAAGVMGNGGGGDAPLAAAADILAGLDWLAGEGVGVVNASLTGDANRPLELAIRRLAARGITVVAAAGNDGPIERPVYPAGYPEALGVTAVDRFARVYRFANRGDHVAFAAPGVGVWTGIGPAGAEQTGTSFAAPYLTAILAAELGQSGDAVEVVLARLEGSSQDLGAPGPDPIFGHGLVKRLSSCGASG